ncbi:hypothetical protein [Sphingorhabdus sp.]|uniref:hypothetical protein n=1 Tax=Sphingorhabdus sp. TaxID=1902408 RepID=UPI0039831EEA
MNSRALAFTIVLSVSVLNGCAAVRDIAPARQFVANPVLDANFPDPASLKAPRLIFAHPTA